jgi:hypothetical protein
MNNKAVLVAAIVALSGCAGVRVRLTPPVPRIDSIALGELVMDHYDFKAARHQRSSAFSEMLQVGNAAREAGTQVVDGGGAPVISGEIRWSVVDDWVGGMTSGQVHFFYVQYDLVLLLRDARGRILARATSSADGTMGLSPLDRLLRDTTRSLLEEVRRSSTAPGPGRLALLQ